VPVSVPAAALVVLAAAAPAPPPITVVGAADRYEISVADPGRPGSGAGRDEDAGAASGQRAAAGPLCSYLPRGGEVANWGIEFDASDQSRGTWWYVICDDGYADIRFVPNTAPPTAAAPVGSAVTPAELARQALGLLPLGRPAIRTAPPVGTPSLVNLPTLVWLPARSWGPRSQRVQAGAVWAEATARPRLMTVSAPNVGTAVCAGPGRPYDPGQKSDCALTFRRPGRYELTVAVEWGGAWVGSGDSSGLLPALETRAAIDVDVVEAGSVLVADPTVMG
jgi:hypothetical protein